MIIGLGTDIIEIERIRKAVRKKNFRDNVFTEVEQAYCESRGKNAAASYAARFAAKEAFFKALHTGIFFPLSDVEILNDLSGAPRYLFHGNAKLLSGGLDSLLSISHSRHLAVATCLLFHN